MSKRSRSARGEIVDFDLIAIKQQLATAPSPVEVNARRKFIDTKDGLVKSEESVLSVDTITSDIAVKEVLPEQFDEIVTAEDEDFIKKYKQEKRGNK